MSKKLIITEKPSVARDFARVLNVSGNGKGFIENNEYVISWCFGHLVGMLYPESYDEKYKSWRLEDLPFLPKDYKYGVLESSKEQYEVVNKLLHRDDIDTVYWAGDSGKEGQTIEENIRSYGGVRPGMTELRVWIDSQTDEEIKRGLREAKPMSDYALLGKSGIMRTIEDYALGINFSRALSVKYGRLLNDAAATKSYSAIAVGRVMTCVLGMVVRREREIRDFVETPFYRVIGSFHDGKLSGEWKAAAPSKYVDSPLLYKENGFKKEDSAKTLISELSGKEALIDSVEKGNSKKKAPLLFNLAELQSECSKLFKISPQQTLDVAQELYEKKLTTYPRTDARVLTKAVCKEINKNLNGLLRVSELSAFAKNVLDNGLYKGLENTQYTDDSKVTDHYAIIPTGQTGSFSNLSELARKVYLLICRRFLSIFYPPAEYKNVKVTVKVDTESFFTSAKVLVKPGFMEVSGIPQGKNDDDESDETISKEDLIKIAETLKKGDVVSVSGYEIKEGKTSPPKRYTSGNLILAMENAGNLIEDEELREQIKKSGIGTSATRGEILEKLVRIKYLNQNQKTQIISPERLGEMVYEVVFLSVPTLLNPEMTANWEMGLDGITNGTIDDAVYRAKLEDYIRRETSKMISNDLTSQIALNINKFTTEESKGLAAIRPLGIKCPACGGELNKTSFGYGCSNYRNEDIKCKFALGKIAGKDISEEDFIKLIETGETAVLSDFTGKNGKPFKAALKLVKDEEGKFNINFDFSNVGPEYMEGCVCPDCGGRIVMLSENYVCEHNNKDDENSCKFFIGKVAGKALTLGDVNDLLTKGSTKTIRGFKSKAGKKFDACLTLKKNEEINRTEIAFDFENVEVKMIKDVSCPMCGKGLVKTSFGYGCSGFDRNDKEKGCNFNLNGKIAGHTLKLEELKQLLSNGTTDTISDFKSKKGSKFSARLSLDRDEDGKVTGCKFVFEDTDEVVEGIKCPKCGASIIKNRFGYKCANNVSAGEGCSFYIGKIAGRMLSKEEFESLLKDKKTEKLSGFMSKAGKPFDAALKLDDDFKVIFDFN